MEPGELLARYDREVRQQPAPEPGSTVERVGTIVRMVGGTNCILYSHLEGTTARAAIEEQRAFYAAQRREFEWKVYAHDRPAQLGRLLEEAGFVPDPAETLMLLDLTHALPPPTHRPSVEVRRVRRESEFDDAIAATRAAFAMTEDPRLAELKGRLADPSLALFVAYDDARPIGAGRLELPPTGSFVGLWGGGVIPSYQHRGVYRALLDARLQLARAAGYGYAAVDAAPTSRPILERLGFRPLARVQGWIARPPSGAESA
jgi:GNAT superfamily N-acetyltransferase